MTLIEDLRSAVGDSAVKTDPALLAPFLLDNRRRFHGSVLCAVYPKSTEDTAAVMAVCARHKALVFVQGGNTSNAAAATPVVTRRDADKSVLIRLDAMRHIEIDRVNGTAEVDAGVILADLQTAADKAGLLFPVSLAAEGSCTVGGALSTNAGGVHVVRYGNMREQCLGLEVVLADGTVLPMLRGLRKDNLSYDLRDLFIGAEGTLGVITKAVVKLAAKPRARRVFLTAVQTPEKAEILFEALQSVAASKLSAFELMAKPTIDKVAEMMPDVPIGLKLTSDWYVLAELRYDSVDEYELLSESFDDFLGTLFDDGTITDAVLAQSEKENLALWRIRESIPEAHKKAGGNVKHDISVPRSSLATFVKDCTSELTTTFPWIAPSIFGHFGDGNLHYNMGVKKGFDPRLCFDHEDDIHAVVYRWVEKFQGSPAAEHGVGRIKRDALRQRRAGAEYTLLTQIKKLLDPENRMNRGALFTPEDLLSD